MSNYLQLWSVSLNESHFLYYLQIGQAQVILQFEICSQRLMAEEGGPPHLHQGEQVRQQDDHALHDEYVLDDEDQRGEHQGEQGIRHQVDEDGDMVDSDQDDNVMDITY